MSDAAQRVQDRYSLHRLPAPVGWA
jgi:hypothetical protein